MQDSKIILMNKPSKVTSFKYINKIKRELGYNKIGHAGTLDPLATGLMITMTNKATKLSDILMKKDKVYSVEMKFGFETDTLDLEGEIVKHSDVFDLTLNEIKETINQKFIGEIKQVPPMYSAIKINGKKLYNLARKNIEVEIPEREVEIYNIDEIEYNGDILKFKAHVSSGTYIRSLVRDIAYELNMVATMTYLNRISIGKFKCPKEIEVLDICDAIELPRYDINNKEYFKLKNGLKIKLNKDINEEMVHIYLNNKYIGIATVLEGNILKRTKLFEEV